MYKGKQCANISLAIAYETNVGFVNVLLALLKHFAVIWPKYCRYGVKHYIINQSILKHCM